ncbi:hypothetical protein DBR11_21205 [Pedobacter sp. HMWF019]|uniref:hypothetical protein n=1 Tax=Pedobacter sp. HMWF019 TaxID=2056856 RepID=UPI000D34052B|nr:hypothetical protein [Pedobacter sp. HMWF019]PTS95501.1 hypothetical protein DBR11_21205 [Pedobacter sp. HMWF019]
MRTSTILIITAVIITLICLAAYNFNLKASYLRGDYKNPFYGLEYNAVKNINALEIESANKISIRVEQGKTEGLWIRDRIKDKLVWSKVGGVLKIDLTKEAKESDFHVNGQELILITPNMYKIVAHPYIIKTNQDGWNYEGYIGIAGFHQDSLTLDLGSAIYASLDQMQLSTLNAVVGDQKNGNTNLVLSNTNEIKSAVFNIPGKSKLELQNPTIVKTNYIVTDKATVSLNGKALQALNQP